jgi:hypothetical protein
VPEDGKDLSAFLSKGELTLELQRGIRRDVRQSELHADVHGERHLGSSARLCVVLTSRLVLISLIGVAAQVKEQGRADAVVLVGEGAGIGEILDLAEHLDADSPMFGEVVFGAPAILEAEAVGLPVIAHLIGEKRIERYQQRPLGQLDDRAEADLIGVLLVVMVDGLLVSALDGSSPWRSINWYWASNSTAFTPKSSPLG